MVGYDGGRVADERLADHVVVTRSEHIPRIQEAQASAYHVLRELVELRGAQVSADAARERPCRGTVQGVGFRPYVYRLARELGLGGFVLNDERGVLIEVEGDRGGGRALPARPRGRGAAAGAWSRRVAGSAAARRRRAGFEISRAAAAASRMRSCPPDSATCDECLAELFDPADRRYRYPFINCTNCGPRFTIVRGVPYDRPLTTMAGFAMCARAAPSTRTRPTGASTPSRMPARTAAARCGWSVAGGDPLRGGRGDVAAGRRDRGRQGARRLPPGLPAPTTRRPSRRCGPASTARTSRSR